MIKRRFFKAEHGEKDEASSDSSSSSDSEAEASGESEDDVVTEPEENSESEDDDTLAEPKEDNESEASSSSSSSGFFFVCYESEDSSANAIDGDSSGKIDGLEKVINKLAEDFKSLEDKQINVLQRHIETSAASIIAALRKDLEEIKKSLLIMTDAINYCANSIKACECNKEILAAFEKRLGGIPTAPPIDSSQTTKTPNIGMAKDDKSPTGLKPATISAFSYIPRP
ncbi:hypothetical protein POTOM_055315 [Populus tomentosa]|uniref:Uncharacterized protein n=1 Tax=Populus tomentosa TaxID=118781 RepID=A0A8X7Y0A9_POPTO|nr:hypothetical protein POTOM_055315 [Populus tomentosa]